jgi:hypothetical protein
MHLKMLALGIYDLLNGFFPCQVMNMVWVLRNLVLFHGLKLQGNFFSHLVDAGRGTMQIIEVT